MRRQVFGAAACVLILATSCGIAARAEVVRVADCLRDYRLDYWATSTRDFCVSVMDDVFKMAGVEPERADFGEDGLIGTTNAVVICSAFRTPALLEHYDFPLQPLGRMHFALYATPSRASIMRSAKIGDWPALRVGYSPVSQGRNDDRERYFDRAGLKPQFVSYTTSDGAVKALADGDVDILFLYTPRGKRPEGVTEIVPIGERNVYFAVRKDHPELFSRLCDAYRECYISNIEKYDDLCERLLGVQKPHHRVRIAAYMRGGLFSVSPDGECSGKLWDWYRAIANRTGAEIDYVFGGYDESLADVASGRLDVIGGIGFSTQRRSRYLFSHTPVGMLRVYLWTHPGSKYEPGKPSTWKGMKVGLLAGTVSGERAKRQFDEDKDISYVEFHRDSTMLDAYFKGEIDACVDVEMPRLADEIALHVYTAHPMYICTPLAREDLYLEIEQAMDEICDDQPKYQRMTSEQHYGHRSKMAALSLDEVEWLTKRRENKTPIYIDFSPWPFEFTDVAGEPVGFIKVLIDYLDERTGLKFMPQNQTKMQTAEAAFMRGETDFWVPYPEKCSYMMYGAVSVLSIPVPRSVSETLGADDPRAEFEIFAGRGAPPELVSIMRKTLSDIDLSWLQEKFFEVLASRTAANKKSDLVFGMKPDELKRMLTKSAVVLLVVLLALAIMTALALRRSADVSRRAAKVAEDHAQAKMRFLAMMSHELRTPLNAVVGFAEFLSKNSLDEKSRKEYTEGILLSSHALLELINDILDLSKLEAGAMQMRSGICDMNQLMRELPAIFGYRIKRHGVQLRIDAPADGSIPPVRLSQQGMRQILINLVGNAAKFTSAGEIAVKTSWDGETRALHMEITDTGCGMSEHKLSKLFNPFVQDIASRVKSSGGQVKGTGLGLPIVKRMVDAAKGTIAATSALGKGTTFTIDIPDLEVVPPEELKSAIQPVAAAESAGREGKLPSSVLVVDDMIMNRKVLGIHLKNLGIADIRFAENGAKALDEMVSWVPDVVLTDMWMPEMDGAQLAGNMHKIERLAGVPVVAVTADVDAGSTYDMSFFSRVIAKPVTGAKLKNLFNSL